MNDTVEALSAMNESTGKINPDQQMIYAWIKPLLYLNGDVGSEHCIARCGQNILITMHSAM
jgi:hypothetical protein